MRDCLFRTKFDKSTGKIMTFPYRTKEAFLDWMKSKGHIETIERLRACLPDDEENYTQYKHPKYTPHMHWGQLYEEGKTLTESSRHSNYFFVDFDLYKYGLPAHTLAQQMAEKKEETGQVYGDYGTRGKRSDCSIHAVFKFDPSLSGKANVERVCAILDAPFDSCSYSNKQGCIIPLEEDIFMCDDELFENVFEVKPIPDESKPKAKTTTTINNNVEARPEALEEGEKEDSEATDFSLRAFDKVCESLNYNLDLLKNHDLGWHSSLVAILSKGLNRIISEGQCKAVVRQRMPEFMDREDCDKLIYDAYHKWSRDFQLSKELLDMITEINKEMSVKPTADTTVTAKTETVAMAEGMDVKPHIDDLPPALPEKLPRTVELLLKPFTKKYWPMLCAAIPAFLSSLTSHFRTIHPNGWAQIAANLYVYIMATSGGGKQNVAFVRKMIFGKTLIPARQESAAKADANKEERELNPEHKPRKYIDKKYYVENCTRSTALVAQKSLGKNGLVNLWYSEAKTFIDGKKSAMYNIDDYLYKAWDLDEYNMDRTDEHSFEFHGNVGASCVMTSPPEQCLNQFFKNTEDGYVRRFFLYGYDEPFDPITPPITPLNAEDQQTLDNLLIGAWERNLSLGDEVEVIDLPLAHKLAKEWEEKQKDLLDNGEINQIELEMGGSIPHYFLRPALSLTAIEGEETQEILEFAKWYAEAAYYYQLKHFYGRKVEDKIRQEKVLANSHTKRRTPADEVFDQLSEEPTLEEADALRKKHGLPADGATRTWLCRLAERGKLEKLGGGHYRKVA